MYVIYYYYIIIATVIILLWFGKNIYSLYGMIIYV